MTLGDFARKDSILTISRLATLFASGVGLPLLLFLAWSMWTDVKGLDRDAGTIKYRLEQVDSKVKSLYSKEDAEKDSRAQGIRDSAQDWRLSNHETRIFSIETWRRDQ